MCNELTWEQEQDIAAYEQWQAEQAWEAKLERIIEQDIAAQIVDAELAEYEDEPDDWRKYDTQDHEAGAAYYDGLLTGR